MQRPNLDRLLKKWQKRLRLQDWNIFIEYKSQADFDEDTACGRTKISPNNFYARIWILEPSENKSWIETIRNVELTLVHELIHIAVVWIKEQEEVVIEKLAQALLEV